MVYKDGGITLLMWPRGHNIILSISNWCYFQKSFQLFLGHDSNNFACHAIFNI